MKKISLLFTFIILAMTTTVNAQDARQMWIGGSVGFTTNKVTDLDRTNNYNILPEVGYVLSENWGIGLSLGYTHSEYNSMYMSNDNYSMKYTLLKDNGFTVNPFVRYSFLKGNLGGMFVDGGIGYTHTKSKLNKESDMSDYFTGIDDKINTFSIGFRPGVALKISDKVILTAKYGFIGYQYGKRSSSATSTGYGGTEIVTPDVKTNFFSLDFDLRQALFGVNFIF